MSIDDAIRLYELREFAKAKTLANKLLSKNPKNEAALNLLGSCLQALQNYDAAKNCFLKALLLNPKSYEATLNLANLSLLTNNFTEAEKLYEKALELSPQNEKAYHNLGVLHKEQKDYEKALQLFLKAVSLKPDFYEALINAGLIHKEFGHFEEAIRYYDKALKAKYDGEEALINKGVALKELKRYGDAKDCYDEAQKINPQNPLLHNNIGVLRQELKDYAASIESFTTAIKLNPGYGEAYANLGVTLLELGEVQKAKGAFLKAIELEPQSFNAYTNLGIYFKQNGEFDNAISCFSKAIELNDGCQPAYSNLGLTLMLLGDFSNGAAFYEKRAKPTLLCDKPLWQGESLQDKTILVYHEQGLGDTIQFARLLPMLENMGAKVLFLPQSQLYSLFKNSNLNAEVLTREDVTEGRADFDYHLPLLSLLHHLGIDSAISELEGLLQVNAEKRGDFSKLVAGEHFKVGIVWRGNKEHKGDRFRSVQLKQFLPVAKLPNIKLYSLQKEFDQSELQEFYEAGGELTELSKELNDFSDTLAVISHLDLIISVDTSVAHLAASFTKPVWMLISKVPDWRWGAHGDTSNWYKSMKIFRQEINNDWQAVFEAVANELKAQVC